MTEQEYIYWLLHIPGVGAAAIFKLHEYFGSFREVWKTREEVLKSLGLLTEKQLAAYGKAKRDLEKAALSLEKLRERSIRFVTFLDEDYPKRLKPLRDKPAALFVKGSFPDDRRPSAAIVGARDCSEYGRWAAEGFGRELAKEGVQIVSGLALGIDGAAHLGALEAGKETFGILGCGINTCYPRENYGLFRRMEQMGGVITEYVETARPEAGNFPRRNRLISGFSDLVIIIEAKEKSGSLITADFALEQGKEVFALPGRITDPLSAGCNRLLQNGASVCLSPQDVLETLGLQYNKKLTVRKISENTLANGEKVLYSFLDSRPKHVEEIMKGCGIGVKECMEGLLRLELLGAVRNCGNQYYCRKL